MNELLRVTLALEDVLAEAAVWVWVPEDAGSTDTDEFRLIAYPPTSRSPTVA